MTQTELRQLFERERLVIAFDTNAIFGNRKDDRFLELCNTINAINSQRAPDKQIDKVISAPVYLEKLHDLRQLHGQDFDMEQIRQTLMSKGIAIHAFDDGHAEHVAKLLGAQYASSEAWRAYKRQRCLQCLGLTESAAGVKGDGKRCAATVDWLVAGHADMGAYLLVTDDQGQEFASVQYRARLRDVCKQADTLKRQLGA